VGASGRPMPRKTRNWQREEEEKGGRLGSRARQMGGGGARRRERRKGDTETERQRRQEAEMGGIGSTALSSRCPNKEEELGLLGINLFN